MIDTVIVTTVLLLVGAAIASTAPAGEPLPPGTVLMEWLAIAGLWIGYWAILVGVFGATPGQWIVRIRVVANGVHIGVGRQLLRCVIAPFAFAPVCLGYIWAILDRRYRSVVDIVTRSTVVPTGVATDAPPTDLEPPLEPLSVAPRVLTTRVSALADALATSGHWRAAGALLRLIGSLTSDRSTLSGAAWAFARAGDPNQTFTITKSLVGDGQESPRLALAADALAHAISGTPESATEVWARAGTVPDEVAAHVEVEIALAADQLDAAHSRVLAYVRAFPESLDARTLAARVARRRDDAEGLLRCAAQLRHIAPAHVDALAVEAVALAPRKGEHRLATREEISALVAVLEAEPFNAEARHRLRSATVGQRRVKLVDAALVGGYGAVLSVGFFTGRYGDGNMIAVPLLLLAAAALFSRYRILRARLTPRTRPWVAYLDALTTAHNQRRGGRAPASVEGVAPRNSVLRSPGRCWCTTLQHVSAAPAVRYAANHLLEAEPSPAPGVFVFRCPQGLGAYVGIDGSLIDVATGDAELYRVEPRDLETVEPDVPIGMYL